MGKNFDSGWLKKKPIRNPTRLSLRRSIQPYYGHSPELDSSVMAGNVSRQSRFATNSAREPPVPSTRISQASNQFKVPRMSAVPFKKGNPSKLPFRSSRATQYGPVKDHLAVPNTSSVNSQIRNFKPTRTMQYILPSLSSQARPRTNIVQRMINLAESAKRTGTEPEDRTSPLRHLPTPARSVMTPKQTPLSKAYMQLSQSKKERLKTSVSEKPKKTVNFAFEVELFDIDEDKKQETEKEEEAEAEAEAEVKEMVVISEEPQEVDVPRENELPQEVNQKLKRAEVEKEILKCYKSYQEKVSNVKKKVTSLNEAFDNVLTSKLDSKIHDAFCSYQTQKEDLAKKAKELEDKLEKGYDVKARFLLYMKKKEDIHLKNIALLKEFKKTVTEILEKQSSVIESYNMLQNEVQNIEIPQVEEKKPVEVKAVEEKETEEVEEQFEENETEKAEEKIEIIENPTETIGEILIEELPVEKEAEIIELTPTESVDTIEMTYVTPEVIPESILEGKVTPVEVNDVSMESDETPKPRSRRSIKSGRTSESRVLSLRYNVRRPKRTIKTPQKFMFEDEDPRDKLKKVSDKSKTIQRSSAKKKRNSTTKKVKSSMYRDLQMSFNLCSPEELTLTPGQFKKPKDTSSARKRDLCRKIQRQMDSLLDS